MTKRRKPVVPITERIEVVPYGTGFHRMVDRMGPEKFEQLRQQTLKDQIAARAKFGAQEVLPREREQYKDYPPAKHVKKKSKRGK